MSDPTSRSRGRTERLTSDEGDEVRAGGEAGGGRRTERLAPNGDEWSQREPVNPGWRSERASGRRAARRGALPSSPQEFQLWLQGGGWRYLVGIAALLLVLFIAVLAFARNPEQREAGLPPVGEAQPAVSEPVLGAGSSVDTLPSVTAAPTLPPAAQFFVVTGTGAEGLLLRPGPSRDGTPITTLQDGTRVEQIGEDVAGGDFVWRQIRAPSGQEGYVAVDFLTPAP